MNRQVRTVALHLAAIVAAAAVHAQTNPATAPAKNAGSGVHTREFRAVAGPDAAYLRLEDRWVLRADGSVVHERSSRLQVNSYLAINRAYGESKVIYDPKVETFEVLTNRTVLPDGTTVVEAPANAVVDDQPPAAHGNPLWGHLRRKVIVHTALEPGAVIEESWRITRQAAAAPWLEVVEPLAVEIPVRERIVEVDGRGVEPRWQVSNAPPALALTATRDLARLVIRVADVAAVPNEPGAPARELAVPVLWVSTAGQTAPAETMRARLHAAGELPAAAAAAVRAAVQGALGADERVAAVFDWVNARIAASEYLAPSLQRWEVQPVAAVWAAGRATPLELAAVQAAALRATGETAFATLVEVAGSEAIEVPGLARFDRAAVAVFRGCQALLFDPLRPGDGGPLDLRLGAARVLETGEFPQEPCVAAGGPWRRSLAIQATIGAKGELSGTARLDAGGAATPYAAVLKDAQKVADAQVAPLFAGSKAAKVRVAGLERGAVALVAEVEGKLPEANALGLVRVDLGGVPGGVEKELPPLPAAGRLAPIALPGEGSERVEVRLALPKGWTAAALPAAVAVKNGVGAVSVVSTVTDGAVTVVRSLSFTGRVAGAHLAREVRALVAAWNTPATRTLLLRPPAETAKPATR